MKKNEIIEALRKILTEKINSINLDELRATYIALLPVTADPELKVLLFGEPEPDDEIKKEQLPAPSAIQQDVQSKSVKEDLPAGTFADDDDELPTCKFIGGDEICEDTLLEKIPHYNDTEPSKPEIPHGTSSGECWVITRTYGFIPDGPGYDVSGDDLIYGLYDSWGPAIREFRNISERTGKTIEEGKDSYTITDWNPATGTAGYTLKKHSINGKQADEDECCELLYAATAESAAIGMEDFTEGNLPELANDIANFSDDIGKILSDAKEILGDELPDTIKIAASAAKETLRQLIKLMEKLAE